MFQIIVIFRYIVEFFFNAEIKSNQIKSNQGVTVVQAMVKNKGGISGVTSDENRMSNTLINLI